MLLNQGQHLHQLGDDVVGNTYAVSAGGDNSDVESYVRQGFCLTGNAECQ